MIIQVPVAESGPGPRVLDMIVSDIIIDGPVSPSGAYSEGDQSIHVFLENVGDEDIIDDIPITLKIAHSGNQTEIFNMAGDKVVFIETGSSISFFVTQYVFPAGQFTITINGTFSNGEFFKEKDFTFEDHDDMSCIRSNFTPDSHHFKYSSFQPALTVEYSTNTIDWNGSLDVRMLVTSFENGTIEVYNETAHYEWEYGSGPGSHYTGEIIEFTFPYWNSSTTGRHLVRYEFPYNDQNMTNNTLELDIFLDIGPIIEGYVDDLSGEPLRDVHVELIKGDQVESSTETNENGSYLFSDIPIGMYTIKFEMEWYGLESANITIDRAEKRYLNMTLTAVDGGGVKGIVTNNKGAPIEGAVIYLESENGSVISTASDQDGNYVFDPVLPGAYLIWSFSETHGSIEKELRSVFKQQWSVHDIIFMDYLISVHFDPINGREDVSPDEFIIVRFSESMDISTFTDENFTFREKGSEGSIMIYIEPILMDGDDSFNRSILVFPYDLYNYDTTYELVLSRDIMSEKGIPLGRNITLTFTTLPYLADLMISSYFPDPAMVNISPDVTIHATYPELLDQATINSSTVMVVDGGGNIILSDITYSEARRTIYVQPVDELTHGEYYIVYLSSEIETIIPGYKMQTFTWSFQVVEKPKFGSLVGRLVDEDGDPFPPEDVEIRLVQGNQRLRTPIVLATGSFDVQVLEIGVWTASFYVYGYKKYTVNELVEDNQTTDMGTITLYKDDTTTTTSEDIDYQFICGACCILILLIIILALFITNQKLKNDKKKNTKLVEKLENLLDNPLEE
jgi:hypothetical protein